MLRTTNLLRGSEFRKAVSFGAQALEFWAIVGTGIAITACSSEPLGTSSSGGEPTPSYHDIELSQSAISTLASQTGAIQDLTSFTIPLGEANLGIRTFPGAACVARSSAGTPLPRNVMVMADDDGVVEFALRADVLEEQPVDFQLACRGQDEAIFVYPVEVVVRDGAPKPAVLSELRAQHLAEVPRPALTGDPMGYSQRELVAQGYPPRPDLAEAQAYDHWLGMVSKPAVRVSARTVSVSDTFQAATSSNWSGPVVSPSSSTPFDFKDIKGQWLVPAVTTSPDHPNTSAVSSIWVGLGGFNGSKSLIQAGTEQDFTIIFGSLGFASYSSWIEWFPRAMQRASNLAIHPGDLFYSQVWLGLSDGTSDINGNYAWFIIYNATADRYIQTSLQWGIGEPLPLTGTASAEWIVERYSIGGTVQPLANYGTARIDNSYAQSNTIGWHSCGYLGPRYFQMVNGNTVLSASSAIDTKSSGFTFKRTL